MRPLTFRQFHSPACYSIQRTSSFCELFGNQSNGLLSVRFPFPSVTPNGLCSRQAGDCEMLTLKLQCADLGKPNCHALHSPAGGCILLGVRLPFRATSYRGSTSLLVGFDLPSAFQSTESRHVYCKPSFPQCHSPACYSIQRTSSFCELFGNQLNGLLSVRFPFPSVTPNGLCSRQAGLVCYYLPRINRLT